MSKNYITPNGLKKLQAELKNLHEVERPKTVEVVSWAASLGDRSENADYIYGKRRLREIDRRVRFLSKRLEASEVIDPAKQSGDRVIFGATVDIEDSEGEVKTYSLVGADETEVSKHRISWSSPMGKALLQSKVGDSVLVRKPNAEEEYQILAIRFEALD